MELEEIEIGIVLTSLEDQSLKVNIKSDISIDVVYYFLEEMVKEYKLQNG